MRVRTGGGVGKKPKPADRGGLKIEQFCRRPLWKPPYFNQRFDKFNKSKLEILDVTENFENLCVIWCKG